MTTLIFYIVDVFAERKYEGNQLAVFRGGAELTTEQMQKIAKEMNYSETTFILSEEPVNGGYDVRIFTPEKELPFAGHPTLGTAYVLRREIAGPDSENIVLNLKAGQIPVTAPPQDNPAQPGEPEMLWMQQNSPEFGTLLEWDLLERLLGLQPGDADRRFTPQAVSTGVPFVIVPLTSLEAVKRSGIKDKTVYTDLERLAGTGGVLVFSPETYDANHQLNARVFVESLGVPEDPATGSANGCLAGYLVKYRYFGEQSVETQVEQGYEIARPSLLYLKAGQMQSNSDIQVQVGGRSILVAKGEFV
ncbi:PhzF family phenazine biosynthesis protein [Paenibacillus gansuensis]|uniref:PhzF family phenazine biosynthesis protein n=1 Tax=Paenibacillus gansuensis TaxID=306542 RepID=A0ABW5P6W7_9BACL